MEINPYQDWKAIDGYVGYYINRCGCIKKQSAPHEIKSRTKERILRQKVRRGYLTVKLSKHGRTYTAYVHRLLALQFLPPVPGKHFVNHKDGNKLNNDLANLEFVSHQENVIHAYNTGLTIPRARKVIDSCSGRVFRSIKEAALHVGKNYNTVKNYLSGYNTNPTCLKYLPS